jgi:hypothetical protein
MECARDDCKAAVDPSPCSRHGGARRFCSERCKDVCKANTGPFGSYAEAIRVVSQSEAVRLRPNEAKRVSFEQSEQSHVAFSMSGLGDELPPPNPHTDQSDRVFDEQGDEIVWPWETPRQTTSRKLNLPCDGLLDKAMLSAYHDGAGGEKSTGWRAWKDFCAKNELEFLRPLDTHAPLTQKLKEEQISMQFVCTLVEDRGIQVDTAANYFGQVQGTHARKTGTKLCAGMKLQRLPQMLKGLKRIITQRAKKMRRGISAEQLKVAMGMLLDPEDPYHANIRAALTCALQGLLRSAEYAIDPQSGGKVFNMEKILKFLPSRADIKVLDDTKAVIMMHPCKNMHHLSGKTVPLVLAAGGTMIDAVAEIRNMLRVDPVDEAAAAHTPLFRNPATGKPLFTDAVRDIVKRLMQCIGQDPSDFGTHSLRIGGATALFAAGATPVVIRTMGRWSSDIYRLYVRASFEANLKWSRIAASTNFAEVDATFEEVDDY